ncbi:MAG: hypothetical protein EAZ85_12880 [Bacteroidetes bacterium]|nr:MAG: hypothetical protein EAZ85_12880 [Bacteroidota bacterium]TAG85704.1 MAG: hypothetical protein EAZ20_14430 [Bacteroidota bacterium]
MLLFTNCNTKKDDTPAPTEIFSAANLVASWRLTAANTSLAGNVLVPDLFDVTNTNISSDPQALAFATFGKFSVLTFTNTGTFTEKSGLFNSPPTTVEANFATVQGTYTANTTTGLIVLNYTTTPLPAAVTTPRPFTVKSLNATTLVVTFDVVRPGVTVTNQFTYTRQ